MEEDAFYTVEELARRWKVNEETVRRFIRRGDLASMILSRKGGHRIPAEEVVRFEQERMRNASREAKPAGEGGA